MRPHFTLAATLLALAGCSLQREPGIYPISPDEAVARLRRVDPGAFVAARGCGVQLDVAATTLAPWALRWTVRAEGTELATFSIRLEQATDGQTRAVVDFPANPNLQGPLVAPSGAAALRQPLQGAVVELVDAALNDRAFDASAIGDDRPAEQACAIERPASRPNPWGHGTQAQVPAASDNGAFGTPHDGADQPMLESAPVHERGHEDRLEDLPRPDN